MRHPILTPILAAALTAGWIVACGDRQAAPASRTVEDGIGRSVRVPIAPRRLVALAPSVTDSLVALGVGERIVGISDFCEPPPGGAAPGRVGGLVNPSLETILELAPDLLVASTSGNEPGLAAQAGTIGLPLYTMHAADVDGVLRAVEQLGAAIGEAERGRDAAGGLARRIEAVAARIGSRPRPRLLFVVWGDPLVVPGHGAFLTDALARAGAVSITADAPGNWPSVDLESVVTRAPEIILTVPQNRVFLEVVRGSPAWAGVPAVRRGALAVVSEAIQQPGPRVVDGIEEVARAIHPDVFPAAPPP